MRLSLARVPRRPSWPAWAIIVVLAWLALVYTDVYIAALFGQQVELCLFKFLTHIPCPTCGLTRGVLHVLHGRFISAWLCNPLLFSIGFLLLVITVTRVISGRAVRVALSPYERGIAWILAVLLILINWAYIIFRIG